MVLVGFVTEVIDGDINSPYKWIVTNTMVLVGFVTEVIDGDINSPYKWIVTNTMSFRLKMGY